MHEENIEFQSFGLRNNVAQLCVLEVCRLLNFLFPFDFLPFFFLVSFLAITPFFIVLSSQKDVQEGIYNLDEAPLFLVANFIVRHSVKNITQDYNLLTYELDSHAKQLQKLGNCQEIHSRVYFVAYIFQRFRG